MSPVPEQDRRVLAGPEVDDVVVEEDELRNDEEAHVGVVEVDEQRVRAVTAPANQREASLTGESRKSTAEHQLRDVGLVAPDRSQVAGRAH